MTGVFFRGCLASALFVAGSVATAAAQDARTVLLFYSEPTLVPSAVMFAESVRESLASDPAIQIEAQYLDNSRFVSESYDLALARRRDRGVANGTHRTEARSCKLSELCSSALSWELARGVSNCAQHRRAPIKARLVVAPG